MDEIAGTLRKRYLGAPPRGKVVAIHLFGIEFATALDGRNLKEICAEAGVGESFATEIRKGVRLAEFVEVKKT